MKRTALQLELRNIKCVPLPQTDLIGRRQTCSYKAKEKCNIETYHERSSREIERRYQATWMRRTTSAKEY